MTSEQIRDQQRDTWNKFSSGWRKHDELVLNWLRPMGDKLVEQARVKDGHLVLDAATGTGEPGLTIAKSMKNVRVIGTDVAADMLKIAEAKASADGIRNYEVKLCNETSIPSSSDHFDAVICRLGVMYFPDPEAAIKEMVRVLKPSSAIALSAWAGPTDNTWATTSLSVVNGALSIPPPPTNAPGLFRFAKGESLSALVTNAGLKDVTVSQSQGTLNFDSADAYWEFITDVVAPIAVALGKITEEQRTKVKQSVIEAATNRTKENGPTFTWSAWVVSGVK